MKLPASAPPAHKRLATACSAAVAIALLVCAATLDTIKHPSLWTQPAFAEESASVELGVVENTATAPSTSENVYAGNTGEQNGAGQSTSVGISGAASLEQPATSEAPTQTSQQGPIIAPTVQNTGAPTVSLAMTPAELDFLLTDEERALVVAGATAQVQLVATPLVPNIPIPPSSNIESAGSGESGEAAGGSTGTPATSSAERQPPAPPPLVLIEPEDLLVMTIAAEQLYNFSGTEYKSGYMPFDISLFVKAGSTTRQVTGTLPTPIKLNVTLTEEIISGTRGMGETFCFVVFHEYRDGSGVLMPEQVSLELGSEEKLTIPVAVRSFSPFIIAWGDVPPIPATVPSGGGGGGTPGTGGGSGGTPSTSTPAPAPAPTPPAADDPAPEVETASTPARPFLAWSPTQTRRSINLRWTPADGADGYLVYGCRCNHGGVKCTPVLITELGPNATSWTERRLPAGEWHKYVVRAFRDDGGRRVILARSPQVHAATLGGKSRTARGVQITSVRGDDGRRLSLCEPDSASNGLQILELSVGERVTVNARELGRKLTVHHRPMRYALWSADTGGSPIVSKDGTFTFQQLGTYLLWAYAQSGTHHMIELRVRE